MAYPRNVLNEIKWRYHNLDKVVVSYVSRGAPNDTGFLRGGDIEDLDRGGIRLKDGGLIPYHRILSIEYEGDRVFDLEEERK